MNTNFKGNPVPSIDICKKLVNLKAIIIVDSLVDWDEAKNDPNAEFDIITDKLIEIIKYIQNGVETDNEQPKDNGICHTTNTFYKKDDYLG